MDVIEGDKLMLIFAFVMPGFLALKTYELKRPSRNASPAQQVVDAICYSFINYALLLGLIIIAQSFGLQATSLSSSVVFWIFATTVSPVVWALLYDRLRTMSFCQGWLPHPAPDPWEYVFGGRNKFWIVATLKNGKKIGGRYGSSSFASSAPAPEQLFLEEAWFLNRQGGFEKPKSATAGVMIWGSEITSLDFFSIEEEDDNAREERVEGGSTSSQGATPGLSNKTRDNRRAERIPTG